MFHTARSLLHKHSRHECSFLCSQFQDIVLYSDVRHSSVQHPHTLELNVHSQLRQPLEKTLS